MLNAKPGIVNSSLSKIECKLKHFIMFSLLTNLINNIKPNKMDELKLYNDSQFKRGWRVSRRNLLRLFAIIMFLNFAVLTAFGQSIRISGTVKDTEGNSLPGVIVTVKGTSIKTATTDDGKFAIQGASTQSTLVFTYIGYDAKEVMVGNATSISVVLKSKNQDLDDVVVVGYGTQKKVNLTGAIAQISGKDLENRPVSRLSQALQGMVGNLNVTTNTAGGAPNATQDLNIRGYTGFGEAGAPLIVIDGVQGGNINTINADDIENISIIKDAASAAIYGSSAPNGVILITTKQGKLGAKPVISYSNNLQFATPINLPKMVNSLDFANVWNEVAANSGYGKFFSDATIQRIKDYQNGTFPYETIQGGTAQNPADSWVSWDSGNGNNDWFKVYFKDVSFSQQHNLGVSGGSENSKYYVGLGYNDRNGMYNYGKDDYKRFNVRANITTTINKWLDFSLRSNFSKEFYDTPNTYPNTTGGNYMHQIARKWPTVPLFNPNGQYSPSSDVPLHLQGGRDITTYYQGVITGEFNLKLAKGWTATANYTFNGGFGNTDSHTATVYWYRPSGAAAIASGNPNGDQKTNTRSQIQVANIFSKYEKQIGGHYLSILGGFVSELNQYNGFNAGVSQLYSDNIPSLNTAYGAANIGEFSRTLASNGAFGRFNYNFKEKYLLEINGRYDATSRFLSNSRWKFYPGVSLGWSVDKEDFFKQLSKTINVLKFRGSYGELGDQSFTKDNWYPFYPSLNTQAPTNTSWLFNGSQEASVSTPGLVNPQLTWITTKQLNLGLDAAFFNNRLQTSFDWYIRKATDFATTGKELPAVLGTSVPVENNAGIKTRGFELSIGWRDNIGEVSYGVKGILSDYSGEISSFASNATNSLSTYYPGQKQGEIWGYTTVGYFQTADQVTKAPSQSFLSGYQYKPGDIQYADLNGDNKINNGSNTLGDHGDLAVIGNSTPRYAFGFNGDVKWKNFDFSFFLQGIAKRDAWINSNYFWGIIGDEWQSSFFTTNSDRWTPTNTEGYFPKYYFTNEFNKNRQPQTKYLQNAAYLRVKNVQLGYSLPKVLLNKVKVNRARFYVSVDNLLTITKLIKSLDPELSIADGKIYPLQRTYSFGVNLSL